MFPNNKKFELLYRGSRDTFKANIFHQKCDGLGPYVAIIISKDFKKIFGGFTDISLTNNN